MFNVIHNSLLSLVYPQECRVCSNNVEDHRNGVACHECWSQTRIFNASEMLCNKCGAFFGEKSVPFSVSCHQCDDQHYDKAYAAGVYEKALAAAIVQLKAVPSMPKRLGSIIPTIRRSVNFDDIDVLIPIPLSRLRQQERGFNQADLIASSLSGVFRIPIDRQSLSRKLHTPMHRIGMDKKARELTVKNAFEVARPKLVDGKNILLVDDVFTSGSTASACAKVLKKNGARDVNVFTLARAVMH
jgi:ComF family protein